MIDTLVDDIANYSASIIDEAIEYSYGGVDNVSKILYPEFSDSCIIDATLSFTISTGYDYGTQYAPASYSTSVSDIDLYISNLIYISDEGQETVAEEDVKLIRERVLTILSSTNKDYK